MKTQGIYLSWIVVKNIEASITFYTETVGLELREYNRNFGWAELAGPEGGLLGLAQENPMDHAKAGTNAVVTVSVEDLLLAINQFKEKGVHLVGDVIEIEGHVKMQTFMDCDGNTLQLVQTLP